MEKRLKKASYSKIWIALVAILAVAIALTSFAFLYEGTAASADPAITQAIEVDSLTVHRGQEFDVNLTLSGNENGMYALRLLVTFDTSAMSLVGCRRGTAAQGYVLRNASDFVTSNASSGYESYGEEEKPFVILWSNTNLMKGNGTLVTLTFRSKKSALVADRENGVDYFINVACDENNTRVKLGEKCLLPVSGGAVRTLYGEHYVLLLDAFGNQFALAESNESRVTLEDAEATRPGVSPEKPSTTKFTYTFRGWKETDGSVGDHLVYEPTFTITSVPYDITFHQGIELDDGAVSYSDERIATFLGDSYLYDTDPATVPYGSIVVFDDYKPVKDVSVHPYYTFVGWFEDIACTVPVSFATMPDKDVDLYGYYQLNVESDDTTATEIQTELTVEGSTVYATFSVRRNFGFNTLRFTPSFNASALTFEGFKVKADSPFVSLGEILYPEINSAIAAGEAEVGVWQEIESGYSPSSLAFAFVCSSENAYATGELVTLKFSIKEETVAGAYEIAALAGERDLTVFKTDGSLWYAKAASLADTLEIKRVEKPTETALTYVYNGLEQSYVFASEGDANDYEVANGARTAAGEYAGEQAVKVRLKTLPGVYATWADGETEELSFTFIIEKRKVEMPRQTTRTYAYTGESISYVFEDDGEVAYYDLSNESRTNAGTYDGENSVFATLKDLNNTEWADETNEPLAFTFIIEKQVVLSPIVNAKAYTGSLLTASVSDADLYVVSENEGGVEKGEYPVRFTFREGVSANYAWKDSDTDTVTVVFRITEVANTWEITPYVVNKFYDRRPIETSAAKALFGGAAVITFRDRSDTTGGFSSEKPVKAGKYTAKFEVAETASYAGISETVDFEIWKAEKTIPTPSVKNYVYNGRPQTYEFENAGDTEAYTVTNGVREEIGWQFVTVSLIDKENTVWKDGGVLNKTYRFEIEALTLSAEDGGFAVRLTNAQGFASGVTLTAKKSAASAKDLTSLAFGKTPIAASGQTVDLSSLSRKCVVARLDLSLLNGTSPVTAFSGAYEYELSYPNEGREGILAAMIRGDELVLFETTQAGDLGVIFTASEVSDVFLLADHSYQEGTADEAFLKSAATCEDAAVYYKSCACGEKGEETFSQGEPLGHAYDFSAAVWNWAADRASATVTVVCSRDETHIGTLDAEVNITASEKPGKETSGFVEYTATAIFGGETYTNVLRELLPSDGHAYSSSPVWTWKEGDKSYEATATFTCDCGESVIVRAADVAQSVGTKEIEYDAEVRFNGAVYRDTFKIDRPAAIFDFADGVTKEQSIALLPGEFVSFPRPSSRENYEFAAWKGSDGSYVVIGESGEFIEYAIGFKTVIFTADWTAFGNVTVTVKDESGALLSGATVKIYNGDDLLGSASSSDEGTAAFRHIPYGNYKLVSEYPYSDGVSYITRSVSFDLDRSEVNVSVVLPKSRFSTIVEGDGSSDGLDGAISDEEKSAIGDGTESGDVNEIVITQKRVTAVSEEIKREMREQLRKDGGEGYFVDFYDVTVIKTVTQRNSHGVSFVREEIVKTAEQYQTNIFPISSALRAEIAKVSGSSQNLFVYKRHVFDSGVVVISNLKKVSPEEGDKAEEECFFIKNVAGTEYIAIRQKEYSVFGFGVSPDPILLSNEITSLTLGDWTFGGAPKAPNATAKYGTENVRFSYSSSLDGEFTETLPRKAGKYFVKAFVPATSVYAAAEKTVPFTVLKKVVSRPDKDDRVFTYNGEEQVYGVSPTEDYAVSGGRQTNAGKYEVVLTLNDEESTVWDNGFSDPVRYEFVIAKKKLSDIPGIEFKDKTFRFDGKRHSIAVTGELPEGVSVAYSIESEYEIGKYLVYATFTVENENYEASEPMKAVMRIRFNWLWILILIAVILCLFIVILIVIEKTIKKLKKDEAKKDEAKKDDEPESGKQPEQQAKEDSKNE